MKIRRTLHHDNPRWAVSWQDGGRQKRRFFTQERDARSFGKSLREEVRDMGGLMLDLDPLERASLMSAYLRAKELDISLGQALDAWEESGAGRAAVPLDGLVREFLVDKRKRGLRPRSLSALEGSCRALLASLGPTGDARAIAADDVAKFLDRPNWGARTRLRLLRDARNLFGWAVKRERLARNPALAVDRPVIDPKPPAVLTPSEAERLIRAAEEVEPVMVGYVALMLFAGLRPESEIGRLTRGDIRADVIEVRAIAKTRKRRLVPIEPNLRAFLDRWLPLGLDPRPVNWQDRWGRLRTAAGWKKGWPQDGARHSYVSYSYAIHGEVETSRRAGHSPDELHRSYRGLCTKVEAEAYFGVRPSGIDYAVRAAELDEERKKNGTRTRDEMVELARKRWRNASRTSGNPPV